MRNLFVLLFVAVIALSTASSQAYIYDWDTDPAGTAQTVIDAANDVQFGAVPERDILGIRYARDAANHYFRLDVAAVPTLNAGAGAYSIQIDNAAGGGTVSDNGYIAAGLIGIDQLVMSHFSPPANEWTMHHIHTYQGPSQPIDTAMLGDVGGMVAFSNGGSTIEWSVPFTALYNGPFTFYGATHDINVPLTFDITSEIMATGVPEPSTLALSLVGLLAFALARNRKA